MGTWTRREFLRDTATLVVGAAGGVFPTGPATASQHVLRFGWQPAIGASMAAAIAARDFQMDRKLIEATMGTRTADPRFTARFHEFMRESSQFLVQIGRLRQVPDTSRYIYTELLERAQREYPQYFADLRS